MWTWGCSVRYGEMPKLRRFVLGKIFIAKDSLVMVVGYFGTDSETYSQAERGGSS